MTIRRAAALSIVALCAAVPAIPPFAAPAFAATATAAVGPSAKAAALAGDRLSARRALARVRALDAGRGVRSGRELSPALHQLALRAGALRGAERREAERRLARPTDGLSAPDGDGYTVPEAPASPACNASFCVHWVASSQDAPSLVDANATDDGDGIPDYVETVLTELDATRAIENGALGWPAPVSDGARGGGTGLTDVYLKNVGSQGFFGYAATDPNQNRSQQSAYLVLDNDYSQSEYPAYSDPLRPLQVTIAHEYNHVLQYAIDFLQDTWMFEATAVWMEDQVYDDVDDYVNYLPRWARLSRVPLTHFDSNNPFAEENVKAYGNAVFNTWISERFGPGAILDAWNASLATSPPSFAPAAYQRALAARGSGFYEELVTFAANLPEWQVAPAGQPDGRGFSEGAQFPDVERTGTLSTSAPGVSLPLDHTGIALYDLNAAGAPGSSFTASLPPGTPGAVAIVGREGDRPDGTVQSELVAIRRGGRARVGLQRRFDRVTGVVVNGDWQISGFDPRRGDWIWNRDAQCATATAEADDAPPAARLTRSRNVSPGGRVRVRFSEPVHCAIGGGTRLLDGRGRVIATAELYDPVTRTLALTPTRELADSELHRVELGAGIVDAAGNRPVPAVMRLRTVRRRPVYSLGGARVQSASSALRRGILVRLRSRDVDSLRYSIRVDARSRDLRAGSARIVGRRSGSLRSRRTLSVRVRLSRAARAALRSGGTLRLRVLATARDPKRNSRRRARTIVVR